jgi:hypothetical protein
MMQNVPEDVKEQWQDEEIQSKFSKEVYKMTETSITLDQLNIGISNEEAKITLKPAKIKVVSGGVEEVGAKKTPKLILKCKHPDKNETISISAVAVGISKGKPEVSGLWMFYKKDDKGINTKELDSPRKGSPIALLMQTANVTSISQLTGKEIDTVDGGDGYLAFKAY